MGRARRLVLAAALIGLLGVGCWAGIADEPEPNRLFGLSLPSFGSVRYNDEGEIHRLSGVNLALGYSTRIYTEDDGVQPERFNNYWGWGTIALIIPYIEFGLSYPIPIADGDQFIVIDLGFLYIAPYINISVWH